MNERIQELIEQSTERYLDWGGENERTELNAEKLAELIVRECADTVLGFHNQFGDSAHNEIRQHFGVEE